jgi:spore germination cell wall hydrolase CwlJ-like protein
LSLDTFAEEIVEPVASRVFARLPFEYGHDPAVPALAAAAFAVTVWQPELAAAVFFPPQPATSNPAATSRAAVSVRRLMSKAFRC